jgi:choline dehydrogenase-like flavoprotein
LAIQDGSSIVGWESNFRLSPWQSAFLLQHVTKQSLDHHQVLGGSSAVNAMFVVRPSEIEVNAWAELMVEADGDAAKEWEWETFYEYMKKSETFTPPAQEVNFGWSNTTFGTSGPMQVSYPPLCV